MLGAPLALVLLLMGAAPLRGDNTETCDGFFRKADCLASEAQCGWKSCMYSLLQCAGGGQGCRSEDKVLMMGEVPDVISICVSLTYAASRSSWECAADPPGYVCPTSYEITGGSASQPAPTSRTCVVGMTGSVQSDEDDSSWTDGFVGGAGAIILFVGVTVVCLVIMGYMLYYNCKDKCYLLPAEPDIVDDESTDEDHDRGGGLDASRSDSDDDGPRQDGIGLESTDTQKHPRTSKRTQMVNGDVVEEAAVAGAPTSGSSI